VSVPDTVNAEVEVIYSNIREMWFASLVAPDGEELAVGRGTTRAESLRYLADEIEDEQEGAEK